MRTAKIPRLAALSGAGFFVLATVGHFITPGGLGFMEKASVAQAFYERHYSALLPADTLHLFSAMLLVIFAVVLRAALRSRGEQDDTLATAVFAATLAAAALMFASASVDMAGAIHVQERHSISASEAAVFADLGQILFGLAAPMALVVAVLGCALAALRQRALPMWLGALSVPMGIALAIPPINHVSIVVFTFWALAVSLVLTVRDATQQVPAGAAQATAAT